MGRQTKAVPLNHGKRLALARETDDEISQQSLSHMLTAVGQKKDIVAFEALFRHYGPRVRAYMAKLARDGQAADELMQETMLAVWNKAHQFDPARGNVSSWIFTIARNLRIDAYRKEKRPVFDPTDPAFVPDDVPPADIEYEGRQQADRLHRALETLPSEQLELLKLAFFNEASHSTIAAELGLPMGTVKSRIRLAFAKLRAALEDRR
ncbi:RNA polymerase sigma factor [Ciceribacter naphthalenivorans]|uniref:RNA polymerase sigma factor n=4 Tax=Alphaproteobacteria TaxID=28211 RepID=A0A512HIM0_9HYPH|nr:sigma-70 family RNA polymerase sigma factor [Ciceribacter naphthalenivorans]GEO85299.1 RNA polymerase sigma factor [Ciceribacter naphthalenivorans]GLR20938.1 RNA polymerase sigma factor [Ciceribacter naphthalenivorans]GLT03794.1 RNA polymerase sigma factor [Sphingomonas psychrolutea]